MTDELGRRLSSIGALADPARRVLYRFVVGQDDAVSRDQAADQTGLPRHAVKFHLDRLVAEGLLEVEFRRLTGRRGPGAGRPSKLYRRSPVEISVSLPERRYELAGQILAEAVQSARSGNPAMEAVAHAAAQAGRRIAADARAASPNAPLGSASAAGILASYGYEPRAVGDRMILVNCPFDALAVEHPQLICGINLEMIRAMTGAIGLTDTDVQLNPAPGRCCVTLGP